MEQKQMPEKPAEEKFEHYREVRRYLSWLGNAKKAEMGRTDPRFREKGRQNLAKARAVLEVRRAERRAEKKRIALSEAKKR